MNGPLEFAIPDLTAATVVDGDQREAVLRYLARLSSEVTTGQLDPALVNWRYIRDQVMSALAQRRNRRVP
jgi:hypothetical protein